MPFQRQLKLAARLLGYGVIAFCLWYLGNALADHYQSLIEFKWGVTVWSTLLLTSVVYAASFLFLALSWAVLLFGKMPSPRQALQVFSVYGRSSIGKYLPSNVLHFVGRQVLGKALGESQIRLGLASFVEIGFSLLSVILLTSAVFSHPDNTINLINPAQSQLLLCFTILLLGMACAFPYIWPKFANRNLGRLSRFCDQVSTVPFATAFALNFLFFLAVGLVAAFTSTILSDSDLKLFYIAAVYLMSWLIGYVVPGASGGLGVREAIIVAQLSPELGEATALAFAIFMRLQTTLADGIVFAMAFSVPERYRKI
ncbi:hypothetical protein [Denitrobaculum tricleocarpae]|uniref:Flippase-like domain-containing protein n=1 Tax=Denitrobaculum tricleocarpae TaxID=2591009 RepID=A0A545T5W3_9PROT|nr:hypothetical protein [Denitrobaculum tricleocarpae]TQV72552.1 hypothetical protein FKG95_26155 [Denitrobaculum tricleocarpae]